jgi:hypothetical protein
MKNYGKIPASKNVLKSDIYILIGIFDWASCTGTQITHHIYAENKNKNNHSNKECLVSNRVAHAFNFFTFGGGGQKNFEKSV